MNMSIIRLSTARLLCALVLATAIPSAFAATLYWDANGATAGTGGTGTWDKTALLWRLGSNTGTLQAWVDGSNAVFEGTAGTITLSPVSISANSVEFKTTNYVIQTDTLTLTGTATVDVDSGLTATISSIIAGSAGLTKTDAGTLILSGNNSYSGLTNINVGTLNIQHANALGSSAAGTVVAYGAKLQLQNNITVSGETLTLNGTVDFVSATGGTVTTYGAYTVHTFTSGGTLNVSDGGSVDYLVVGGGGGGGGGLQGGGGGAGGLLQGSVSVGNGSYAVVVGAGGTGHAAASTPLPTNGANSSIAGLGIPTALGGGAGASQASNNAANLGLTSGIGSGGGGTFTGGTAGGLGTAGQGNSGGLGTGSFAQASGGGGGAGGVGQDGTGSGPGAGGLPVSSSITGSPVNYARGGSGSNRTNLGPGADGAINTGNGGNAGSGLQSSTVTVRAAGGVGGSGIVIIRYVY